MKTSILLLVNLCGAVSSGLTATADQVKGSNSPSSEVADRSVSTSTKARCLALETAGAFTNDGYRIRDADWSFPLKSSETRFLQVSLFEGNHYWFVAATPTAGVTVRVIIYDAQGNPVKSEQWQDGGAHEGSRAAAGIAPKLSGSYFVGIEAPGFASDVPLDCSLVMAYK